MILNITFFLQGRQALGCGLVLSEMKTESTVPTKMIVPAPSLLGVLFLILSLNLRLQ
jgi:hypothetical protein